MFKLIRLFSTTFTYSPKQFNYNTLNSIQYFNNLLFNNIVYYFTTTSLKIKSVRTYKNFNYLFLCLLILFVV